MPSSPGILQVGDHEIEAALVEARAAAWPSAATDDVVPVELERVGEELADARLRRRRPGCAPCGQLCSRVDVHGDAELGAAAGCVARLDRAAVQLDDAAWRPPGRGRCRGCAGEERLEDAARGPRRRCRGRGRATSIDQPAVARRTRAPRPARRPRLDRVVDQVDQHLADALARRATRLPGAPAASMLDASAADRGRGLAQERGRVGRARAGSRRCARTRAGRWSASRGGPPRRRRGRPCARGCSPSGSIARRAAARCP